MPELPEGISRTVCQSCGKRLVVKDGFDRSKMICPQCGDLIFAGGGAGVDGDTVEKNGFTVKSLVESRDAERRMSLSALILALTGVVIGWGIASQLFGKIDTLNLAIRGLDRRHENTEFLVDSLKDDQSKLSTFVGRNRVISLTDMQGFVSVNTEIGKERGRGKGKERGRGLNHSKSP